MLHIPTMDIDKTNAAVGGSLEDIGTTANTDPEITLGGTRERMCIEVKNTGGSNAITGFEMQVKAQHGAGWVTTLAGTDWATAANIVEYFKGAPHTLATGVSAVLIINVRGMHQVKFRAVSSSGTSLTIKGVAA